MTEADILLDRRRADEEAKRFLTLFHEVRDKVHAQEIKLVEHTFAITVLTQTVEFLRGTMATSAELTAAVTILSIKLDGLRADVEPFRKSIYWLVGLVFSALILAALGFLFRRPV